MISLAHMLPGAIVRRLALGLAVALVPGLGLVAGAVWYLQRGERRAAR